MNTKYWFIPVSILLTIVGMEIGHASPEGPGELKARAERFFRGVYGGDSSVIDELASDKIVISYAIFEKLFKKATIRGRDDVKKFSESFSAKWTDAKVTIDEAVVDGNKVVLIWSFQARWTNAGQQDGAPSKPRRWGGISFFQFDKDGKIEQEIGEESAPGPFGRLKLSENASDSNDR